MIGALFVITLLLVVMVPFAFGTDAEAEEDRFSGDIVLDANGERLRAGYRVKFEGDDDAGTITSISDFDADYDGERYHGINPRITVQWDSEAESEVFHTFDLCTGPWDDHRYQSDELVKIGGTS